MRLAVLPIVPLVAACASSHVAPQPLPPLVAAPPAQAAGAERLVIPGEHMIWEVASDGITVGRAEMLTTDRDVLSKFTTEGFASMFANVHQELMTPIASPPGERTYNLHTAIAFLRAWSPHNATPAALDVVYDGDRYHVTCEPPIPDEVHDTKTMRVACNFGDVALVLELAADRERAPLRAVARTGSLHLEADLISRELRGARATPVPQAHASAR